jgi:hypothetical protein
VPFINFPSPQLEIQCFVPSGNLWAVHWYHNYRTSTGFFFFFKRGREGFKFEEVTEGSIISPDTDGLLEMREEWRKRKRSDTISTV